MEIECKHCGNMNQLGVVFCRFCGAKMEIDNIAPKDLIRQMRKNGREKKTIHFASIAMTLFWTVVVLAILAAWNPMWYPSETHGDAKVPPFEELLEGKAMTMTISGEAAGAALTEFIKPLSEEGRRPALEPKIHIAPAQNRTDIAIRGFIWQIPIRLSVRIENSPDGKNFHAVSYQLCNLPRTTLFLGKWVSAFMDLTGKRAELAPLEDRLISLKSGKDGKLTVSFRATEEKKAE